ncbi:hypothetical protein Tco_0332158 [Tanacetum coccineum]
MVEYSQKWHNGTSRTRSTETSEGLAAIQAQLNNLGREIQKVNEKVYAAQKEDLEVYRALLKLTPKDHVKSISTIVEADASSIHHIRSHQYTVSTRQNSTLMYKTKQMTILFLSHLNDYSEDNKGSYRLQFSEAYSYGASHIDKSIPRKEKDPWSFTLPCYINNVCFNNAFANLGASISVMPLSTYLNLGLGELAHNKLTVELVDKTVKYPKGIAENVLVDNFEGWGEKIIFISVKPASSLIKKVYMLSLRERMELDLEVRLMRETLVLNRSLDPFFEDYIEPNDLNVPLELRRYQIDDLMPTIEEGKVIDEFIASNDARMVSKIFRYPSDCDHDKKIRIDCALNLKFSCMIDFALLEDMDAYRDEEMGEVSKEDMMNGIYHSYQKLKSFYKGVLNLGPEYFRDAMIEEWLTHGHISVHEME